MASGNTYISLTKALAIALLTLWLTACTSCDWHLLNVSDDNAAIAIERYDRIESLYLTTGDFSALQQMNTSYPQQTRALIEDVLRIGQVNDPEINTKFLTFFQDSALQRLVSDVELEYADMTDLNEELTKTFERLSKLLPGIKPPTIYAQIGSLDQSIIVGDGMLGISLDKYMGRDFWLYLRPEYGYTMQQRQQMTRANIVPDCVAFYLMSLYPPPIHRELSQSERDLHVGKIQWVVNQAMKRQVFRSIFVNHVDLYMKRNNKTTVQLLLSMTDYSVF